MICTCDFSKGRWSCTGGGGKVKDSQVQTQTTTHHGKCGLATRPIPGKRYRICDCWASFNGLARHKWIGGRIVTCDYVSFTGQSAWFCSAIGGGYNTAGYTRGRGQYAGLSIHKGTGTCVNKRFLVPTDLKELHYLIEEPGRPAELDTLGHEIVPAGYRTEWLVVKDYDEAESRIKRDFPNRWFVCLSEL